MRVNMEVCLGLSNVNSILVIVCFIFNFLTNNCIHNDQVANSSGGRSTIVGPIGGLAPSTFLSTNTT